MKKFANVDIGRDKNIHVFQSNNIVKSLSLYPNFTNFMQNTEGCANFESYKIETGAIKFGDKKNSYVHMKTNVWMNDYLLELEFRTLYPSGLIFISVIQLGFLIRKKYYIISRVDINNKAL